MKTGQIAHVDQDSANSTEENLVWLCFEHHDQYDSKTSQGKGLTEGEVLTYREALYDEVERFRREGQQQLNERAPNAGGDAKVAGNGLAIGGPGGRGRFGGAGGSAYVGGDGIAAGGEGGSEYSRAVWPPPARSGYEHTMRTLGLPVDHFLRQFGRGGAPGWLDKFEVVSKIRADLFAAKGEEDADPENARLAPLAEINERLAELKVAWRARVIDDDRYEFFIP